MWGEGKIAGKETVSGLGKGLFYEKYLQMGIVELKK